jgi:hypothetical protein
VAAAVATDAGRHLIADQLAAAAGDNRRAVDKARPLLLVAAGGEPSHTAAVRRHAAQDHGLAGAGGINGTLIADKLGRRKAAQGAVRRESSAKSRGAVLESGRNGSQRATAATASGPPPPDWRRVDAGVAIGLKIACLQSQNGNSD